MPTQDSFVRPQIDFAFDFSVEFIGINWAAFTIDIDFMIGVLEMPEMPQLTVPDLGLCESEVEEMALKKVAYEHCPSSTLEFQSVIELRVVFSTVLHRNISECLVKKRLDANRSESANLQLMLLLRHAHPLTDCTCARTRARHAGSLHADTAHSASTAHACDACMHASARQQVRARTAVLRRVCTLDICRHSWKQVRMHAAKCAATRGVMPTHAGNILKVGLHG